MRSDRASRTRTVADIPGRRLPSPAGLSNKAIRTGTRCTMRVKLPVALSGANSANCAPLAGEKLSRSATKGRVRHGVDRDIHLVAQDASRQLRLLEVGDDPKSGRHQADKCVPGPHVLTDASDAFADAASHRRAHRSAFDIELASATAASAARISACNCGRWLSSTWICCRAAARLALHFGHDAADATCADDSNWSNCEAAISRSAKLPPRPESRRGTSGLGDAARRQPAPAECRALQLQFALQIADARRRAARAALACSSRARKSRSSIWNRRSPALTG